MPSLFQNLLNRPTRTDKVHLAYYPDDQKRVEEARRAVSLAQMVSDNADDDGTAAAKLAEAKAAYDDLIGEIPIITFHMAGIGPKRVEQMLTDMPATDKQQRKATKENNGKPVHLQWDEDRFPMALLSAVITKVEASDPELGEPMEGMTVAQVDQFWESNWSVNDRQTLFLTALSLDQSTSHVEDLGKGSA